MCEFRVVWKCDGKRKKSIKKNIIFVFPWKQKALRERERAVQGEHVNYFGKSWVSRGRFSFPQWNLRITKNRLWFHQTVATDKNIKKFIYIYYLIKK